MKVIFFILWSLLCLTGALIPEIAMYFTWGLVSPTDEVARIALIALFWIFGGGMCVLFGVIGFFFWVAGVSALAEQRW